MLIASRLHFTPPSSQSRCTLCTWRETDGGEGITTTTVSLHLFICHVPRLALYSLLTPIAEFCRRWPLPQTVQMVIVWMAPLTDHIALGVMAKKNIARYW